MFTKCPECSISFRVTAKVLQQASGNVRCGGCNHAFNALHYLSEELPDNGDDAGRNAGDDKLAETSRRLLETLDELAGPDEVQIEDTGVEWRVLNKDEVANGDASGTAPDEMRYDDSTLLPDDFGLDGDEPYSPPEPIRRASDQVEIEETEIDPSQGDLALSEPEDWTDLLDEVRDPEPEADSLEVEEELAAIHNQLSAREAASDQSTKPADLESQFDTQAEAMGLDITGAREALAEGDSELDSTAIGELLDADDADKDDEPDEAADDTVIDSDVLTLLEDHAAEADDQPDTDDLQEPDDDEDEDDDDQQATVVESLGDVDDEDDDEDDDEVEIEEALDIADAEETIEDDDDASEEGDEDSDQVAREDSGEIKHYVPPPTEDEMTVNMEIDQEMMALAKQDDDFSATLFGVENPEDLFNENADEVETIIMEGDFIRGAIEEERLAAENAAKSQLDDPASLVDTYAMRRGKVRGGRRRYDPAGFGVLVAVVVLTLLLVGQYVHNSRDSLATNDLFARTIAPIYRMLGMPVTPAWNIKGWQFEATNGNVDESETSLTIVSRIVNRADRPLPYPLVHVSLTDRWEDIMGSRILEPGEYLAGDLDPSSPVLPGENFTAVITIENPSAEATGFKLNVCYRVRTGTVRCAIEDFKN